MQIACNSKKEEGGDNLSNDLKSRANPTPVLSRPVHADKQLMIRFGSGSLGISRFFVLRQIAEETFSLVPTQASVFNS